MIGHGYYGKQLSDQIKYERKFAWWPVISNSKCRIWLRHYYVRHTYYDLNGRPPIHSLSWKYILTQEEYLLELLK